MTKQKGYSQAAIVEELFRRGELEYTLYPIQKTMRADILASKERVYVVNSSRRIGKSHLLCTMAIEYALRYPNSQIRYACETQRAVKKIVHPIIRAILQACPAHLRPKYNSHESVYTFKNDSQIHIAGAGLDQADSLRGTSMDLGLIDEAGFIGDLEYLIESVLKPQMLTRPNARIIMASTPPKSPDHVFVQKYMVSAMAKNAYSKYTIYDNAMLSPELIEEWKQEAGGEDSTTWRREYLAEVVTDTASAIFPEATEEVMSRQVYIVNRPTFFQPFTAIDLGYIDYTGVVFGYYHFLLGKVIIEDEILVNKTTSVGIVELIRTKEKELWGNLEPQRVIDAPAIVIADLNADPLRFRCRLPDKSDLTANVNLVRVDIKNEAYIFHPKCKELITQVRFATWNKQKNAFTRNASGGHQDLVAALIYYAKHLDRTTNPFPADHGYNPYDHFGYPRHHKNKAHDAIKSMFPRLFNK